MKQKILFYCTQCGNETPKWQGKCVGCGAWNTIVEQPSEKVGRQTSVRGTRMGEVFTAPAPKLMAEIDGTQELRFPTGMRELDRVLGGGAVHGSLVLVGGAPGIGKSTLMLQICDHLCQGGQVLYISGEESERQIKLRAERLRVRGERLHILSETRITEIQAAAAQTNPKVLIVDSIQTLHHEGVNAAPGSISQVKECTLTLMQMAKGDGLTIFVIGHVNKEGSIAGPKVLEHMVDCVLYFEGERHMSYRILRAAKNRFGATNEIGVFEMEDGGLVEIPNPSEVLLSGRPEQTPGTCVTCVMEGIRPILAEVQALVVSSSLGTPRRVSNGLEYNRAMLLLAVLEKRGGLLLGGCDAYLNVVGGLSLDDPGADLATVMALASSFQDRPLPSDLAAIGEVGLTGELRSVHALGQRLSEVSRLGFRRCLIPKRIHGQLTPPQGLQIISVATIREALTLLSPHKNLPREG